MDKVKILLVLFLLCLSVDRGNAQNVRTVDVIDGTVTVDDKEDLHVLNSEPFTVAGSIDIKNEDAVVFFDNVKPSRLLSEYLTHIYVNGQPAENDNNIRVGIYVNGSCVYPHGNSRFNPLEVYTEENWTGERRSDFVPNQYYRSLEEFNNEITSFKLKRGYMATLATSSDGTGYSRCFVAQDSDLLISKLDVVLDNKVSFIRILPWQYIGKKGSCGGTDAQTEALECSWYYNWSANGYTHPDYEFVPIRATQWWPSYDEIEGLDDISHLLGNNEPDHADANVPVEDVANNWSNMLRSGLRVGSPASTNPNGVYGWLVPFFRICDENNYRVDYVAVHEYWYATGKQFDDRMNEYYNLFKRPIWITEFNYGANWTTETWPDPDRKGTPANYEHQKKGLSDIVTALENNPHVERYAIYNWVEDCRMLYLDSDTLGPDADRLTPAGKWYAELRSKIAYSGGEGYIPGWNHHGPEAFEAVYSHDDDNVSFSWECRNGEQTDSTWLERKTEGDNDFKKIACIVNTDEGQSVERSCEPDDVSDLSGIVTYRVRNFDSDGNTRLSNEVKISIGRADGISGFQSGRLGIIDDKSLQVDFSEKFDNLPAVFMGIYSNNNSQMGPCNLVSSVRSTSFSYNLLPWELAGLTVPEEPEYVDFLAAEEGNRTYGNMPLEVGSARVDGDTAEIEFKEPFPDGTVPVVAAELRNPSLKSNAISIKIWDVTERGFKAKLLYEYGLDMDIRVAQNMVYFAVAPGVEKLDENKYLSAGRSTENPYSVFTRTVYFTSPDMSDTLHLVNPVVLASLQTYNLNAATILRRIASVSDDNGAVVGMRIRRQVDSSNEDAVRNDKAPSADVVGWIVLSDGLTASGIDEIADEASDGQLDIEVADRVIYVKNHSDYNVYSMDGLMMDKNAVLEPGVYIVRSGKFAEKVLVR